MTCYVCANPTCVDECLPRREVPQQRQPMSDKAARDLINSRDWRGANLIDLIRAVEWEHGITE